jgi:predicted exporter
MTTGNRAACGLFILPLLILGCQTAAPRAGTEAGAAERTDAPHAAPPAVAPAAAVVDQAEIQGHLDELAGKIAALEGRLGQGRGALRGGSSFMVDGLGNETVLEHIRRLERELAQAKGAIAGKDTVISGLRHDLATATTRGEGLAEKADSLSHVQDSLVVAQQELAERQAANTQLKDQIAASELARLRAERAFYVMAGGVLRLQPGQSQELLDVQDLIRTQVREAAPK